MNIKDMMHKGVECVSADTVLADVARRMREKDIGAVPVNENGRIVGIITDRDIVLRAVADAKDIGKLRARDIMTADVAVCAEGQTAADAVRMMESRKIRRLPVVDGAKHLVGMISLGDVSHAMPGNASTQVLKAVSAHHA